MFVHLLYGVDIPPGLSTMLCVLVSEKKEELTQQTNTLNFTTNNLSLFHVYVFFIEDHIDINQCFLLYSAGKKHEFPMIQVSSSCHSP